MVNFNVSDTAGAHPSEEVVARANELYWHSEVSVNGLARELDLSKGMLYEILAPLPAGLPCPLPCPNDGEDMSYTNRTARDRGFVSCASCGFEDEEEQVRALLELRQDRHATDMAAPPPAVSTALDGGPATSPDLDTTPDLDTSSSPVAPHDSTRSRDPAPHGATPLPDEPPAPRRLETLLALSALAGLAVGLVVGGLLRRR